ncbi:hypothetical protein B0J12DRAFT_757483 [Macrophomina phaseolina]|uniref:Heterokaryon incompatibility domain-containing protein n=1 Tax=Macrophomina phaseolina TaxID=35725 RepID=A0ABQ8G6E3_9PEZI|nr:hypothetical protein B0J12DRAFT_757483 [Macrophomina phaseolina]
MNLLYCLQRLRHEKGARSLWADAICINQRDYEIEWDAFNLTATYIQWSCIQQTKKYALGVYRLYDIGTMHFWDATEDLTSILDLARNCRASDPRNKVYALLSHRAFQEAMRTRHGKASIPIDYGLSCSTVYLEATKFLLLNEFPLDVLSSVGHVSDSIVGTISDDHNSISWVPQWDSVYHASPLNSNPRQYDAAGHTEPQLPQDGYELKVRGIRLDYIKWQSGVLREGNIESKVSPDGGVKQLATIWNNVQSLENEGHSVKALLEKFCLTLNARNFRCSGKGIAALKETYGVGHAQRFVETISPCCERCFFITERVYFGIGPRVTLPGDELCVFFGGQVPFALRPCGGGRYKLCGECYVHGIIDGDIIELWKEDELEDERFILI